MAKLSNDEKVRQTIRLSKALHSRLREAAAVTGETVESIVEAAISSELETRGLGAVDALQGWDARLASRYLECLPTPAVIKDSQARILWCDFAYEDLFDRPIGYLLGRKVTELGLFEQESSSRLECDIRVIQNSKNADAREFWEPLTLLSCKVTLLFRAHRFVFRAPNNRTLYLGDISFDCGQILPGYSRQAEGELPKRLRGAAAVEEIDRLCLAFLSTCPAAMALKDLESGLVWCNPEYEKLAGDRRLADLIGKQTQEIFGLKDTHPIVHSEYTVGHTNVWMYAVETLPKGNPRTSLRFPILGQDGLVRFVGVVSAEFRQEHVGVPTFREVARR